MYIAAHVKHKTHITDQAFQDDNAGVSASLYVDIPTVYRVPLTELAYAMHSSSAISSGVSFTDKAPMFCTRFSILVVPGIGTTSFPWMSGPPPQMIRGPPPTGGGPPRMLGPPPVGAKLGMPPPGVFCRLYKLKVVRSFLHFVML
ncbi:hypothetical protein Tco_0935087 [Tanacetum coccineum]